LIIAGLTACAAPKYLTDPIAAENSIKCKTDNFSKITKCDMPTLMTDINGKDSTAMSWRPPISYGYFRLVKGEFKDQNVGSVSLNGNITSNDWLFINSVRDSDGKTLKMEAIDSDVNCKGGCTTKEYFVIDIDKEYLSKHDQSGIQLKFYGKRGDAILNIPAAYVQGFNNYITNIKLKAI